MLEWDKNILFILKSKWKVGGGFKWFAYSCIIIEKLTLEPRSIHNSQTSIFSTILISENIYKENLKNVKIYWQ